MHDSNNENKILFDRYKKHFPVGTIYNDTLLSIYKYMYLQWTYIILGLLQVQ